MGMDGVEWRHLGGAALAVALAGPFAPAPPTLAAEQVRSAPLLLAQAGGSSARDGGAGERVLTVINDAADTVREIYVVPAGTADPGPDRLGSDVIPPGGTLRVRVPRGPGCRHDLRVVYLGGQEEIRTRLDLCRRPRVTLGDAGAPRRAVAVLNETDLAVQSLYLDPPGAPRGADRLGSETLPAGRSLTLRLGRTRACVVDAVAVLADGSEERAGLDLCREARLVLGDPAAPRRPVSVANRGDRPLREIYARPEGAAGWGPDRLGETMLDPGAVLRLTLRGRGCRFDLRAAFEAGPAEERRGVDLCAAPDQAFDGQGTPLGPARSLAVANRRRAAVRELYFAAPTAEDWGPDRLDDRPLPPGGTRVLTLHGLCRADLRVVFESRAAEERRDLDLCARAVLTLEPDWVLAPDDATGTAPAALPAAPVPAVEAEPDAAGRPADAAPAPIPTPAPALTPAPAAGSAEAPPETPPGGEPAEDRSPG